MSRLLPVCPLLLSLLLIRPGSEAIAQRYLQTIFPAIQRTNDVSFGSSVDYRGRRIDLLLDLYQPQGDTAASRALVIFVHGGGFVGGDKGTSQFVTLCTEFARRGYATASINYRLDTTVNAAAVMNAMHDAKAAVRFFRRYASTYRIDTTRIAMGGGSAGAYTSLATAYIDKPSELLPGAEPPTVEGGSGNPGYSSRIHACLDYWGALPSVDAIESPADPPLLIVHGTADSTVSFRNALDLDARASAVGLYHEFYPLQGAPHGPWNMMDSIVNASARFLYRVLFTPATSMRDEPVSPSGFALEQNYPNPFRGRTTIRFRLPRAEDAGAAPAVAHPESGNVRLEWYDPAGRRAGLYDAGPADPGRHEISLEGSALAPGTYLLLLRAPYGMLSRTMRVMR